MKGINFIICIAIQFVLFFSTLDATRMEKVVIIGAGAAGTTAAIFTAQAHLDPLVIQDLDCKPQMTFIPSIDNYPGVLEEIEGIDLLNYFQTQAKNFGARFIEDSVVKVDLQNRPFKIEMASGDSLYAESIIIASGTKKQWLELPSETALKGKGIVVPCFSKNTDFYEKNVVIVGNGHEALEEAIFIANQATKVTIVNRGQAFNASKHHQIQVFNNDKIEILYNTEVIELQEISQGNVNKVVLKNTLTEMVKEIPTDLFLVAIGNQPNTDVFKGQLDLSQTGHIVINGKNTSTNIPGVFAAGDVTDVSYGYVVIAAGSGGMAAFDVIRFLNKFKP